MFLIKARVSDVDKYGSPGLTALFDMTDEFGGDFEATLSVHEVAILIRDLGQALAESQTQLAAAEQKALVASVLASRSVE